MVIMRRRASQQSTPGIGDVEEQTEPPIADLVQDEDRDKLKRALGRSLVGLLLFAIVIDSVGLAINFQTFRNLVDQPLMSSVGVPNSAGGTRKYQNDAGAAPRLLWFDDLGGSSAMFQPKTGRTVDTIWLGARDENYKYYGPMKLLRNPVTLDGRNGEKNDICKPAAEWQEVFYPTCNDFHAVDFGSDLNDGGNKTEKTSSFGVHSLDMLGVGTMRDAWKLSTASDEVVLKTLQLDREFSERTTYYQIVDAVAAERLTSSPYVQDIYGFCGSSVYNELGREFQLEEGPKVPVMDRFKYARDLAAGLADAHSISGGKNTHLVHADLRHSNVLFSLKDNSLKLSDFNQGYFLGWNKQDNEMCGYRPNFSFWQDDFAAPEECLGEVQTEKTDVYHMGGIIFYLMGKQKPYETYEDPEGWRREVAKSGKWPVLKVPNSVVISRHPALLTMRKALEACWNRDPKKRATAREVYEILDKTYQELTTCKASPLPNSKDTSNFKSTLPNVLLVGAQKSGTTATASFIFHHRNVCRPTAADSEDNLKELHYYDLPENYERGLDLYGKHFCHCGENTHIMDATPDYLPFAKQAKETYDSLGPEKSKQVKVILVLREPVEREFSWYNHMTVDINNELQGRGYTSQVMDDSGKVLSFDEYVEHHVIPKLEESHGQYAKWIKQWIDYFGRERVFVLAYEELANDQYKFMERLRSFLKLEKRPDGGPHQVTEQNIKVNSDSDKPILLCKTQKRLAKAFEKANNELYNLLDKHHGPSSEQRPFPKFKLGPCKGE